MIALVFLFLILTAGAAAADPGSLVVALLGGSAALGAVGAAVVQIATGLAASAIAQRIRARRQRPSGSAIRTPVTTAGGTVPQTLMLGTCATGGNIVAPFYAHGEAGKVANAFRTQIIDIADLPIEEVTAVIVDDIRFDVVTDLTGPVHPDYGLSPATSGAPAKFAGRFWVKILDGRQTMADAMLVTKFGNHAERAWSGSHIGTGVAHAILTFRFDSEIWRSEPRVRFEVKGARVYDWRADTTAGGSGPQREDNAATWTWTDNPIVLARAVLRGIPLADGTSWGLGVDPDDLPTTWWTAAADRCDEIVDGAPRYRAGFEVRMATAENGGDTPFDVLDALLEAASAEICDVGGRWIVRVGAPDLPVATITDDDILIDHTAGLTPFPALSERYNAVRASYVSPDSGWQPKEAPLRKDDAAIARDGRMVLADLDLPAVWSDGQAQRLMEEWLRTAARWRRHVVTLPPDFDRIGPFDVIAWTSVENGYAAKLFEVISRAVDPSTLAVTLGLREIDHADYDWEPSSLLPSPAASTVIVDPPPASVPGWAVSAVSITDGDGAPRRPGIRLSWAPDLPGVAAVRYQIRLAATLATVADGSTDNVDLGEKITGDGVVPATAYQVRGRLVMPGRATEWTDWTSVTTDPVYIGPDDLDPGLATDLGTLHDWIDGGVTDLPGTLAAQAQAITDETLARIADAQALADNWRAQVDTARALAAEVAELAAADHAAREQLRQSLSATLGDMRATYDLAITALAGEGIAAVARIETLEADSDDLSALIQTTQAAIVDGDEALALLIATLSVGSALAFDHAAIWYFDSDVEGWTGSPSVPSVVSGWLRPGNASTADSPSGLAVAGGSYAQVRARLRKVGSPTWTGHLWWAGVSESWDAGRRVTISEPAWDDGVAVVTFNPDWSGSIDRIRLDLVSGSDGSNYIEVDWAAVGRPAPGASSADIVAERQARIDGDDALASDLLALSGRVEDAETGLIGQGTAISALDTRVDAAEGTLTVHSGQITALEADVTDPETGLGALSDAIDLLTATVEATEGGAIVSQAQALRALESAVRAVAAEGIEGAARMASAEGLVREYIAKAAQDLNTRVDLTDAQVTIVAQAVTILEAAIPGLATADALQALTTTVNAQGGTITSQGEAITALTSIINSPTTGLATKLAASVIASYYTKAETDGVAAAAASSAVTSLQSSLEGPGGSIAAAQDAAQDAYDLAGSKGKVLVQSTTPVAADRLAQNLWIDTTGSANTPKRWNGSAWVAVTDKVATDAAAAAAAALSGLTTKADASVVNTLSTTVSNQGGKITAISDALLKLGATVGATTAETVFRMTTEATPAGALARIGLKAVATGTEGDARVAALFLDALAGDQSRVIVQGDAFYVLIGSSTVPLFIVEAGVIRLNSSLIRLDGDVLVTGDFKIASGPTGERIEITKSRIAVYDAAGVARVVIGDLTGF